jgi:hypothetical protein
MKNKSFRIFNSPARENQAQKTTNIMQMSASAFRRLWVAPPKALLGEGQITVGSKLKFADPLGGYTCDISRARSYLQVGCIYTVKEVDIEEYITYLRFEEVDGRSAFFNSVQFVLVTPVLDVNGNRGENESRGSSTTRESKTEETATVDDKQQQQEEDNTTDAAGDLGSSGSQEDGDDDDSCSSCSSFDFGDDERGEEDEAADRN